MSESPFFKFVCKCYSGIMQSFFTLLLLGIAIAAIEFYDSYKYGLLPGEAYWGAIIGAILLAFIAFGFVFVIIDMRNNINNINKNLEKIYEGITLEYNKQEKE